MARKGRRDEAAMRSVIEQMALLLADFGLPRMAGRVLFLMMGADERTLTAAELARRLDTSPASISGAVRLLMQISMVVREPIHGSRGFAYRLVDDAWYEVTLAKMMLFKSMIDLADLGVDAAGGDTTKAGARLAAMRDFYAFVQERLPQLTGEWAAAKGSQPI